MTVLHRNITTVHHNKSGNRTSPCIDSRWIAQTYAFRREVTRPQPLCDSWMLPGHAYGSVLRDNKGMWRMWYLNDPVYCSYYATSNDGLRWQLPKLGVQIPNHDGAIASGNAFMRSPQQDAEGHWLAYHTGPEGFCVLDNDTTPHPAADERFTALYLTQQPVGNDQRDYGLFVCTSDDGIHWRSGSHNPVIKGWHDTNNMFFFDTRIGRYVLYGRPDAHISRVANANRLIGRCESEDMIHWTPYHTVLDADDTDADPLDIVDEAEIRAGDSVNSAQRAAAWQRVTEGAHSDSQALIRGRNRQWYGITVFPYADIYIGIGMMYDVPTGHMWLELIHSYDGIDWRREHPRRPWLGFDPQQWDYPMQVIFSSPPIQVDNELWMYYSSVAKNHHGRRAPGSEDRPLRCIGGCKLARDRWVGYRACDRDAELLTQALTHTDIDNIAMNAATKPNGWIRVEICDVHGAALSGFELENCQPIVGDDVNLVPRWNNLHINESGRHGIRLRIVANNATLYAINVGA